MASEYDSIGQLTTYGGSLTACLGSASYVNDSNMIILGISLLGALIAMLGLVYTIWSGERSYRLQLRQTEVQLKLMEDEDDEP